jgi:UDP-glucose 4-epimerase
MNILVTGGAGFIGSHLCEKLLKNDNFVICIDNFSTGNLENIRHIIGHENFFFVKGDIRDKEIVKKIMEENSVELVFHYAAVVGVKRTLQNPKKVLDVNIQGTINVLEAANEAGVKKVIFASSSEVYGEPLELPEKEDGTLNPKFPYAVSKLCGEKYCEAFYKEFGLKTTSLRFFNVYGPRQDSSAYGFVIPIFIKRVLFNKPPVIYGDGMQTRDFTFIDDNIEAALITAKKRKTNGEVINIGTGKTITILELANIIIKLCKKDLKPIFTKSRNDIRHRCADITKMKRLLDFEPRISLKEGLKKTIEWYKENKYKR